MSDLAFIFPGQGSQVVGMGRELADAIPAARDVFEEVDEALGEKLSTLIWEGPEESLTLTANTQPALMAVSIAAMRALEAEHGVTVTAARYVAGHSLGEYSALCAAGALSLSDTARLLRRRGEAMQAAVPEGEGAMAALLGADMAQAEAACTAGRATGGVCEIANDNAPGQLVLSGSQAAVGAACEDARAAGVKKAVPLAVSAPFHCSLMRPAGEIMAAALAETAIRQPVVPVVTNVTAGPAEAPETIRQHLIEQVTGRVRWRESVAWMADNGIAQTAEAGVGKVLTVMNRRNVRALKGHPLGTPDELANFVAALAGTQ
ncbi:MAG: ACP S-malonyltransferase [Alphaproteobacteria bacterium]|jgi:[acyl-carrier-protein] S-malonyltransferase|nr:ACP S-malonyltransferase [Alphaproteobacteria bacterium]